MDQKRKRWDFQAGMGKDKDLGATSTSIPGHDSPPSILFHKSHSTQSFCWSLWLKNYQTCISMSICLCNRWLVSMTTLGRPFHILWPKPRMPFPALSALSHLLQLCSHWGPLPRLPPHGHPPPRWHPLFSFVLIYSCAPPLWSPTAACSMKTQCWYWVLCSTMSQAQSLTTAFSVHFEQNEHETIKHKSIQNSDCEWTSVIKVGIKNKLRVPPCGLTYLPHTQQCLWEKGDIPVVVQRQATQLVECPTN